MTCLCSHEIQKHLNSQGDCLEPTGKRLDGRPIFCGCRTFTAPSAPSTEEKRGDNGQHLSIVDRNA